MKTKALVVVVLVLLVGAASMAVAQAPAVQYNTWSNGTPIPIAVDRPGVAVLNHQIYLVGGGNGSGTLANTQIYNPATNTWSAGGSLKIATGGGCAAVVKNVLYFIGGNTGGQGYTNAVWAYNPKKQTWTPKASMPTPRGTVVCVVETGIIYVIGGYNGQFLDTLESYNPATNSWTPDPPDASMPSPESDLMGGGLVKKTIIVVNGSDGEPDGHNYGYSAAANTWQTLPSDPTLRQGTCVVAATRGRNHPTLPPDAGPGDRRSGSPTLTPPMRYNRVPASALAS